ncbi:hypothetical protein MYAM1_003179 [Malassezia yamatoensis]|uniref:Uncharacterized protein n=1 Tax=Malassezia yamatoensis TaxID=253288 RepID=A0AAJ5YU42_9BASI|nr:hypothetical protein MYAM1_003179 [Malassezia yamatoensis]
MPTAWVKEDNGAFETTLSGLALFASTLIITPYPDITTIALILGIAQINNLKPHAPMKASNDLSANAYASMVFAVAITAFITLRKVCEAIDIR